MMFSCLFFSCSTKPHEITPFAMSFGESVLRLFVPQCTMTWSTVAGNEMFFMRQSTCWVLSPGIPQFNENVILKNASQTYGYRCNPQTIESPNNTILGLDDANFAACFWCSSYQPGFESRPIGVVEYILSLTRRNLILIDYITEAGWINWTQKKIKNQIATILYGWTKKRSLRKQTRWWDDTVSSVIAYSKKFGRGWGKPGLFLMFFRFEHL